MMILGTMPMVELEGCLSKVLEYLESLKYAEANELLASLLGRPCWRSRKMYDEIPVLEVKDAVCSLAEVLDRCLPIGSEWRTKAVSDPAGFVEHMMSFLRVEGEDGCIVEDVSRSCVNNTRRSENDKLGRGA